MFFSVDPVSGDFCRRISDNGEWFELTPPQRNTKTIVEESSYCVLMVFEMIYLANTCFYDLLECHFFVMHVVRCESPTFDIDHK